MTNKLVVFINSLKVPKIEKILLYEMKFLVPNYSCLQNPWLGGYRPQITVLSVLNWICWLPPPPEQNSLVWHWGTLLESHFIYLGNKKIYCIFKTCCTISVLFSTKCCFLFHTSIVFCSNNAYTVHKPCAKFKKKNLAIQRLKEFCRDASNHTPVLSNISSKRTYCKCCYSLIWNSLFEICLPAKV